jgi:hypothetical protein
LVVSRFDERSAAVSLDGVSRSGGTAARIDAGHGLEQGPHRAAARASLRPGPRPPAGC